MAMVAVVAQASEQQRLSGIAGWVADVIASLGPVGVALLTALENLIPPVPSEVVLPLAGYLASQDRLTLAGAVIAATVGSLIGAIVIYEGSAAVGNERMRAILERVPLMDADDVDQAESWFDRHGGAAVFLGRFVPGVRSLVSIPAGIRTMPRWRFWLYTTAGSALWNAGFVLAGYFLGSAWTSVGEYSDWINYVIIAAVAVLVARFVWSRRHRIPTPGAG